MLITSDPATVKHVQERVSCSYCDVANWSGEYCIYMLIVRYFELVN